MKCTKAHKLMSAALDGELSGSEQELLAAHLKQCVACGKEYQAFQEMHRLLRQAKAYSAPPYLASRVMARLDSVETRPSWAPWWANFAEALVLLMVIGIGVLSGNLFSNSLRITYLDNGIASMSLEIFDAAPPESLGGAYLAMLEVSSEK